MLKLTAAQITEIADHFTQIAEEIGRYIVYHNLSIRGRLGKLHLAILDEAEKLYTQSAIEIGKEAEAPLAALQDVTSKVLDTYEHLNNIKQAIELATGVLNVVKAITGLEVTALVDGVKELQGRISRFRI